MDGSDEEFQSINNVALLDSQRKQGDCPCDENLYVHLFRGFRCETSGEEIEAMALKKELCQKLVASLLSRPALSDGRGGGVTAS
jgi:hypothetical protein